ncbi:AsnC family transcriptional regulator [Salinarchaeum sp. Harcht-Bsk1]|uniref:siroheme decarboxylase subunit beta n=1 Tax=Salinarchaeum sp. Harcht-Bsk1 TaxID=1333523 RepID=UPI00034230F8|nr:Lrp/AsnC family transcriptional regulator [Salinarchaeum sp. Harcht-Bsk1]AGN01586.1 AsnC family transcriptional regulator [Salinarchaeum sp. Harcht-Bsk1]
MSEATGDWRASIDDVDARILDGFQSGFPIEERPFRVVAEAVGTDEQDARDRVEALLDRGLLRRFGPVLNPPVIGASTLAALKVPEGDGERTAVDGERTTGDGDRTADGNGTAEDRFAAVAEVVNGHEQVNHNYRRDHEWNMWFVVTAGSLDRRDEILAEIAEETGLEPLVLPMLTDYYIDLEFPVVNDDRFARESAAAEGVEATRIAESARGDLSAFDADLLLAIQEGFPVSTTPYRDVAASLPAEHDATVADVLAGIERLSDAGCVKRIGCIVNHVATGFDSNCMVVWDVPDDELDDRGSAVGGLPYVTLCYHRPRRPERDWPYNLFTMIHGRDADAVDRKVDELAEEYLPVEHERLFSTETLKQTGARYEALLE